MSRPDEVILNPGGFCFAGDDRRIRTLLGSCVSITLWQPRQRVGGMCHYMNPTRGTNADGAGLDGRYADEAVRMFLREMERRGTLPREYDAKIFGGANQFPGMHTTPALDVSRENVATGLRLLRRYGFTLSTRHLGGTGYRQLVLDLATGTVDLTHVDHVEVGELPACPPSPRVGRGYARPGVGHGG